MARPARWWVLPLLLLMAGCAAPTPVQAAALDQEITRNILWRYHQDARFSEVRVRCERRTVTLEGRVSDPKAARDALEIAQDCAGSGRVVSSVEVHER